jgi:hypothetical protein
VLLLVVVGEGILTVCCRDGDFLWHRRIGAECLAGQVSGGTNVSYPVGRSVMDALLALAPYRLTRAAFYLLALLAVFGCWRTWRRLAEASAPAPAAVTTAAAAFTGLLLLCYVVRDLDECGLQLFLLFFLTAALAALLAGRDARAGFWLATAVTYKAAPLLVLPFLLWKRRWRAAGWTVVFVAAWAAAPVPLAGLAATAEAHADWLAHVGRLGGARQAYPSQLAVEQPLVSNVCFQAAVARNLETYPPGHPLYLGHPLVVQPGTLDPAAAYHAVRGVLLAVGLLLAWRFRRPWAGEPGAGRAAVEWAVVCLCCALFAPVCWTQHLVLALPAAFLAVRATLVRTPPPLGRAALLLGIGLALNLTRDGIIGRDLSAVVFAYKLDTWAMVLLAGLALTPPGGRETAAGNPRSDVLTTRAA